MFEKNAGWKIRGKGTGGYGARGNSREGWTGSEGRGRGSRKQPRGLDRIGGERTWLAETAARARQDRRDEDGARGNSRED